MTFAPGIRPSDIMAHVSDESMRAHVDVDGRLLTELDAEAPLLTWSPWECPSSWLPVCAFNYSVTLYEDIWSEDTKRAWIDGNWSFIRQIGTIPAFSTALAPSGYSVQQVLRPPIGWYAVETQTKEEYDDWIRQMPELRITYGARVGGPDPGWFVDEDFVTATDDEDFVFGLFTEFNDGPALIGRFGFIRQRGVVTPLARAVQTDTYDVTSDDTHLQYSTPGENEFGLFEDDWYVNDDQRSFVGVDQLEPQYVDITINLQYVHETSSYYLDFIEYSKQFVNPNFEITSDIGDAGNSWFVDDGFVDDSFVQFNEAPYLIAQRVYIIDPTVIAFTNNFGFYVGDRLGLDLRTIEMVVDLNTSAEPNAAFIECNTFVDDFYILENDDSDRERAFRAIEAARGQADRVLVSFETKRPLEAQDYITEKTLIGDWVRNAL